MNCGCIEKVNAQLREHNQELRQYPVMTFPECESSKALALEVIGTKKGVKGTKLFLRHCPLCGRPDDLPKDSVVSNLVWATEEEAAKWPEGILVLYRWVQEDEWRYATCAYFHPCWVMKNNVTSGYSRDGKAEFAKLPMKKKKS